MKRTLPLGHEKQLFQRARLQDVLLNYLGLLKGDVELPEGAVEQSEFVEGVLADELGVSPHLGSGKRLQHSIHGRGKPGGYVRSAIARGSDTHPPPGVEVDRSTTGWIWAVWTDHQPDKWPAHRPEQHQSDGLGRLAKVRVAGSNPVVRSKKVGLCGVTSSVAALRRLHRPGRVQGHHRAGAWVATRAVEWDHQWDIR